MLRGLPSSARLFARLAFVVLAIQGSACTHTITGNSDSPGAGFDFFADTSSEGDIWFYKVAEWQTRAVRQENERTEPLLGPGSEGARLSPEQVDNSGLLRLKMGGFAAQEKRRLAKKINTWSQREARRHYRIEDDQDPRKDNWPTFEELLASNGDDCDGLDLIVYGLLLDFGFQRERVYRAIVRRERDRGNHMVTLWFEDPNDPWVLDATGAMTFSMRRFSEVEGWTPLKVFNEREQFRSLPSSATLSLNQD